MASANQLVTPSARGAVAPFQRAAGYIPGGMFNNVATGTPVAGLSVAEYGDGPVRTTVVTLTAVAQTWASGTAGSQFAAAITLYNFPKGYTKILGAAASLTITASGGGNIISTFTAAYGVGTVAGAADTMATTTQNIVPSTSLGAATAYVSPTVAGFLAADVIIDGHTTANKALLNSSIAADAGITAADTATVTGTVTFTWMTVGDY